jgi:ABC-type branched-subunit amino acid transport system ATPase component/branched-subunit amino acid ABC-type transport system permease component
MGEILRFLLIGLGLGGIYALLSQGLVLIYRGSGVLNLAQGAVAYLGATIYYELQVAHGLPTAVAVTVAIVGSAVVGVLIQQLVMRPMRRSSALTKLLATLGLMLVIENMIQWITHQDHRFVDPFLPHGSLTFPGDIVVGTDRVVIFAIACVISAVLWLAYSKTRFGLITSAAAEDEDSAAALGHSANLIATVNWAAGSALAGLAGVLVAPIVGLTPNTLTFLVVPALACALCGGFRSFPLTLAGACAIGVIQSEVARYTTFSGWADSVPFMLIIVLMYVRGKPLPLRRHVVERLPMIGTGRYRIGTVLALAVVAGLLTALVSKSWQLALTTSFIGILFCLSVVVVTGLAGQLSLCQLGFAGFAAWATGRMTANFGLPFTGALLIGGLLMIPIGLVVGIPALRMRGVSLAIVTFGLALVFERMIFSNPGLTGGFAGTNVGEPTLFGWSVYSNEHPFRYAMVALFFAVLGGLGVANLRRSATGRRLIAVRSNERAAASLGIRVLTTKLYAFSFSAVLAGLGGVLLAYQNPNILFANFSAMQSLYLVMYTVLAGVGLVSGGVVGGMLLAGGVVGYAAITLFHSSTLYQAIAGALLVVTMIVNPDGTVLGQVRRFGAMRLRREQRRADHDVDQRTERDAGATAIAAAGGVAPLGPPVADGAPVASVDGLSVRFGGVVALDNVSFDLHPGEIVGLIGPNGAGKTTVLDALSGFNRNYAGSITVMGRVVDKDHASERAGSGLRRTFQSIELFDDLSVYENLLVASERHRLRGYVMDIARPTRAALPVEVEALVEEFSLREVLRRRPGELPYGQRRLVGIAQAAAVPCSVLMLDEPAAGLDSAESLELAEVIRQFAKTRGAAVLLVEHDFEMVMGLCDRIVVLDFGEVIATGTPAEIRANDRVRAAYLGEVPSTEVTELEDVTV